MPVYQTLKLPAGMKANGTLYQNRGAWYDGNRVRWDKGLLRPIGGWDLFSTAAGQLDQVLTDPANQVSRSLHAWKANDGSNLYVVGHNQGLKAFSRGTNTVFDITPAGFTNRLPEPATNAGFGGWFFGLGAFGTERPSDADDLSVFSWCFRNWGQNLLASERVAPSRLYEWNTSLVTPAAVVANAPTDFDCHHVTEQRIVMVAGSASEPRLIQWSDSEDNTSWTPSIGNQAGNQILPGNGRFKEIVDFRDQTVLISEADVHVCRYLGPPYVFGFDQVGANCGTVAGAAVVATEDFVVWPGKRDFYIYDGSVRRLPCDVIDRVTDAIASPNAGKIVGWVNAEWAEVWWLYQSDTSETGEVDSYIVWDYVENHWHTGKLDRTSVGGQPSVLGPLMMGADGYLYKHELAGVVPSDGDNSVVYAESGPIELKNGDTTQYIESFMPDFIDEGSVNVYLIGQDSPTGPEVVFGPYVVSYPYNTRQPVPVRARGHSVRVRIEGLSGNWSLGDMRLNFVRGGGRK